MLTLLTAVPAGALAALRRRARVAGAGRAAAGAAAAADAATAAAAARGGASVPVWHRDRPMTRARHRLHIRYYCNNNTGTQLILTKLLPQT